MDTTKQLKDSKGVPLCRNMVQRIDGCARAGCYGWHPKRGTRDAKTVLDAINKAMPACPFDVVV